MTTWVFSKPWWHGARLSSATSFFSPGKGTGYSWIIVLNFTLSLSFLNLIFCETLSSSGTDSLKQSQHKIVCLSRLIKSVLGSRVIQGLSTDERGVLAVIQRQPDPSHLDTHLQRVDRMTGPHDYCRQRSHSHPSQVLGTNVQTVTWLPC